MFRELSPNTSWLLPSFVQRVDSFFRSSIRSSVRPFIHLFTLFLSQPEEHRRQYYVLLLLLFVWKAYRVWYAMYGIYALMNDDNTK